MNNWIELLAEFKQKKQPIGFVTITKILGSAPCKVGSKMIVTKHKEILKNGDQINGYKGGTATSEDGSTIAAVNFFYNKLTNILELTDEENSDNDLIIASIDQKMADIKPVNFNSAIDFRSNKKL